MFELQRQFHIKLQIKIKNFNPFNRNQIGTVKLDFFYLFEVVNIFRGPFLPLDSVAVNSMKTVGKV